MPNAATGCGRRAPRTTTSRASMRPSGLRSARSRRPRSRCRSWPRSRRCFGCRPKKKKKPHEVRPGESQGRDRRGGPPHPAPRGAGVVKKDGERGPRGRGGGGGGGQRGRGGGGGGGGRVPGD